MLLQQSLIIQYQHLQPICVGYIEIPLMEYSKQVKKKKGLKHS